MRLVTFRDAGAERPGAVLAGQDGDRVLDLCAAIPGLPATLAGILGDDDATAAARRAVDEIAGRSDRLTPLAAVRLAPPVRPGKILCLGYNYAGHVADESAPAAPPYPDVFVKTPNTLSGPDDPVALPAAASEVDYEGEIAVVVGRRASDVPLAQAASHIAGYTLLDDVSARDWQRRSGQLTLGKCFDGFSPLGPWIVTPDEVPDPQDLLLEVLRDGLVTVRQSTSTMVFTMPFLVHYLSQAMTLEPGDVISTGTPVKLPEAQASHRPLGDGDQVTVRVAGLGSLTTTFVVPRPAAVTD